MSAARSRHRDQSAGGAPGQSASPVSHPAVRRRLLLFLFVLAAAWSLALLLMDVLTTGGPAVGPGQILKSDVVVIARRIDGEHDRVEVERVFKGEVAQGDTLRIINLAEAPRVVGGTSYIFALSQF